MFERLETREPFATLSADPAVPAGLLIASTVVVVLASVLPGTVGVAFGVGAVLALAVPCAVHLRDRHETWLPMATTWWGEALLVGPALALFGLYLLGTLRPGTGVDVPAAFGPAVVAFGLGAWTRYRAVEWYVDGAVGDDGPLATWRARASRRRRLRNFAMAAGGGAIGAITGPLLLGEPATQNLLSEALASAVGATVGAVVGSAATSRRTYEAFDEGLRIERSHADHRFLHREQITGFDLTDRELVIRTTGWFGDKRLRCSDLDDVERIRAVLEYYDGTRPHPPERRERPPAGVAPTSQGRRDAAGPDHQW